MCELSHANITSNFNQTEDCATGNIKYLKIHLISVAQFLDAHSTYEEKLHDSK